MGALVAQAVRRSPPTAGVPSSRLGPSTWVSWWTKRGLGRFFSGFLPFSPITNFIPPFLHTHPFRFISSALVMVRQAWSAGTLATHWPTISGLHRISSLHPTLCWIRVEDIYFNKTDIQRKNTVTRMKLQWFRHIIYYLKIIWYAEGQTTECQTPT